MCGCVGVWGYRCVGVWVRRCVGVWVCEPTRFQVFLVFEWVWAHSIEEVLPEWVGQDPLVWAFFVVLSGCRPTRKAAFLRNEWGHSLCKFYIYYKFWPWKYTFLLFTLFSSPLILKIFIGTSGCRPTRLSFFVLLSGCLPTHFQIFQDFEWVQAHSFKHFLISRKPTAPLETVLFPKTSGPNS